MSDILLWAGIGVAAYAFSKTFRREVNSGIVKLANMVQGDTAETAKAEEMHLVEDVAFQMFQEAHPNDPRAAGGWKRLPPEIRQKYVTRAVESLIPPENKPSSTGTA